MNRLVIILVFSCSLSFVKAQTQATLVSLNHADFEYAATAKGESYMSATEKQVVQLINLARVNPQVFINQVLLVYRPDTTYPAVASLLSTLRKQPKMEPLAPSFALYKTSSSHAMDLGFNGTISQTSTNGSPFYDRMHQVIPGAARYAETMIAGPNQAIDITLGLLLDVYDPKLTNRKTLLSPKLQLVGCSIRPHRSQCHITVLDLVTPQQKVRSNMPEMAMDLNAKREFYGWNHCPKNSKVAPVRNRKNRFWIF